ncbi:MAG: outer membrane protein assembly factor BamA [Alphaproteobacteria bacterium]|nr:outer membrane protein assembly factor BamA [Alphaproteobacteria bacterium]
MSSRLSLVRACRAVAILVLAGALFSLTPRVDAQSPSSFVVEEILVQGNQRIEGDTVRSYMGVAVGDRIDSAAINEALKALFATGLFADVNMRREGGSLVVSVVENPIINRLAFEGNRRIDDEALETEVQLRPRIVFTRSRVQSDVQRIVQVYRRSGRFAATVEPKVIQLPQNRVDLVFEISEGPLTGIRKIAFIGNKVFQDGRLRSVISTKEARWYRFFTSADKYDPDRLNFDRELLRRHYLANGYADFRVVSAVAELGRRRADFFITITVEEGERYTFGEVGVSTELRGVDADSLLPIVTTAQGQAYNADEVENSIQNLTFELGRLGYAFVDVRPEIERDREGRQIAINYNIDEGPRVYVDRINIVGNVRTLDRVLRREMRLAEGDAFNAAKLRRSQQRIRGLGFFEKVNVRDEKGLLDRKALGAAEDNFADDRTSITIEVEERSTGELSFGIGYSSSDQIGGEISIRERNLLGRGQNLNLTLAVSTRRQEIDLSFTEPYFLNRDIAAGFDVFNRQVDQENASFDRDSTGFTVRAGYPFAERLRHAVRYTLRSDKIEDVSENASRFIQSQRGSRVTSSIGQTITYDLRDDRFFPTEGYIVRLRQDLAGLGGDVNYLQHILNYSYHRRLWSDWIGSLSLEEGHIFGIGERVNLSDRFFLGGNSFRGFAAGGVGPRDTRTLDFLGGTVYYLGTAEVSIPLGILQEFGVFGRVFTEVGSLADADLESTEDVFDVGKPRVSSGFGISWRSPFGPILLDFAWALRKESFDREESFRFSFGSRF